MDSIRCLRLALRLLGIATALALAGCGSLATGTPTRTPTTGRSGGGKPAGPGTPVPGEPQTLVPQPDGHYESVIASGGSVYLGADTGTVYAFDAGSGKSLWQRNLGDSATSAAGIYATTGGLVFAAATDYTNANPAGTTTAYGLRAASGAVAWRYPFPDAVADLLYAGGALYANDNNSTGNGSTIYALDAVSGAPLWRYTATGDMPQPVQAAGGIVYAETLPQAAQGAPVPALIAVNATTGRLLWTYHAAGEFALPTVAGDLAYLAVGDGPVNTIDAVDTTTGTLRWRFSADPGQSFVGRATVPMVANGALYVASDGMVYALRASDGHLLWRVPRPETHPPIIDTPVAGDGGVYVGAGQAELLALRASDGATLWERQIGNIFGMTDQSGLLVVMTQSNAAYGLSTGDGTVRWKVSIQAFATWDPLSLPYGEAGGTVGVATQDGTLSAIRAADGQALWQFAVPPPKALTPAVISAIVTFSSGVARDQALHEITDLGLTASVGCAQPGVAWQPVSQGGPLFPTVLVVSTPEAEPNWLSALRTLPGVAHAMPGGAFSCPLLQPAPPGTPAYLDPTTAGSLVRVSFDGSVSYDRALSTMLDQGFRLVNPCYERLPQGASVAWMPMGQETSFAETHALLVLTTRLNATDWQARLQVTAGVIHLDVQPALACPTA